MSPSLRSRPVVSACLVSCCCLGICLACSAAEQVDVDPGGTACGSACDGSAPALDMTPPGRPSIGDGVRLREPALDGGPADADAAVQVDAAVQLDAAVQEDAAPEADAAAEASADAGPGCDPDVLCATGELTARAPRVLLLVDRSGSMTYPFSGGLTRWEALTRTLADPQDGVIGQFTGVEFGLVFYTYRGVETASCDVLSQVFHEDFMLAFEDHPPILDGQTPTAEALTQVAQLLRPSAGAPGPSSDSSLGGKAAEKSAPSAVILATDGMPDSCLDQKVDTDGSAAAQRQVAAAVVAQVTALFSAGIPTYVVGVGSQLQRGHLQDLANAGVGYAEGAGVGQPGKLYQAGDSGALRAAFDDHVSTLQSCGFDLDQGVLNPSLAEVTLDGRQLVWGTDWVLQAPDRVSLIGSACEELKQTGGTVRASFPCGCD